METKKNPPSPLLLSRRRFLSLAAAGGVVNSFPFPSLGRKPEPGWFTMNLPYFHQSASDDCYQACLAMILKFFFPQEDFPAPRLNSLTRHRPGYWTLEAQLVPALLERQLQVELHASTPYAELTPELAARRYGPVGAGKIDFQALAWAREVLTPGVFFPHEMEWNELASRFRQGWAVMFCVNEEVLMRQNRGRFLGHGLVLTGVSETHARVHDPARQENMLYPQRLLAAAFGSPGTDHAVLLVKR